MNQPGAPSLTALKCQDVSDPADSSISIQVLLLTEATFHLLLPTSLLYLSSGQNPPTSTIRSTPTKYFGGEQTQGAPLGTSLSGPIETSEAHLLRSKNIEGNWVFATLVNRPIL